MFVSFNLNIDSSNGLSISLPSDQQKNGNVTENQPGNKDNTPAQENKPKVTLEERVARGEAQVGPTVPVRQEQQANQTATTGIRQVFPLAGEDQRQERSPSPSLQRSVSPSSGQDESKKAPETSGNNQSTTQQPAAEKETKSVTPEEEEQIVASILKQLTPLVEELVANEVRRVRRGLSVDSDELESLPFPFMFAGAPNSQGQSATGFRVSDSMQEQWVFLISRFY